MSVHEILLGFKDNIQKSRNPFFGTFVIVWLIRNWQFILTLFNLQLYPTMEAKVEALKDYFSDGTLIFSFFLNAFITLGVLIVTYVLLNLSRAIVLLFENHLSPWVQSKLDPKSIVPKAHLVAERRRADELEVRLMEERARRVRAEEDRDSLEKRLQVSVEMDRPFDAIDTLLGEKGQREFLSIVAIIRKGQPFSHDVDVTQFLQTALIYVSSKGGGYVTYALTQKGDDYCDYLLKKMSRSHPQEAASEL